jgi:hypothetical protein
VRASELVRKALPRKTEVVLLGSIASAKYTRILLDTLGDRLLFPVDFVGRGDMSRGGLLLRAARSAQELTYAPVQGALVRGRRVARLAPLPRQKPSPLPGEPTHAELRLLRASRKPRREG